MTKIVEDCQVLNQITELCYLISESPRIWTDDINFKLLNVRLLRLLTIVSIVHLN